MSRTATVAVCLLLLACKPSGREPEPPANGVSAGGVTLTSASITLPDDGGEALTPGSNVDLVSSRCTACHSAGMILTQPRLSTEQWAATVKKMREVYKAPVPAEEDATIVAYLTGLSAKAR